MLSSAAIVMAITGVLLSPSERITPPHMLYSTVTGIAKKTGWIYATDNGRISSGVFSIRRSCGAKKPVSSPISTEITAHRYTECIT